MTNLDNYVDQFYKPNSISPPKARYDLHPGNYTTGQYAYGIYNELNPGSGMYDPIPYGAKIIDQATFVNACSEVRDPNFVPSHYYHTRDGENNIRHISITAKKMYGGTFRPYRTINNENMIALTNFNGSIENPDNILMGLDLYAGTGYAPLYATVVSALHQSVSRKLKKLRPKSSLSPTELHHMMLQIVDEANWGTAVFQNMTTPERDAAPADNGWIIYNSTSHTFQGYANGAWVNLH